MLRIPFALLVVVLLVLPSAACTKAPPNLSPAGQLAFNNTRVIKGLDLLRDFAIDGNAQTPPIISTDATRKVVTYHESALKLIHASGTGWQSVVATGLDELPKDVPAADAQKLAPYIALVKAILTEATR